MAEAALAFPAPAACADTSAAPTARYAADGALPWDDRSDAWNHLAHALGQDYARHGVTPPPEHLALGHPLRQAWQEARGRLGRPVSTRTGRVHTSRIEPAAGARALAVQDWLDLRLQAWLRGQPVQALTVTPNLLRQLQVEHCPVTRERLRRDRRHPASQPVIAPLCPTAALAAGHLAMLGRRAAQAQDGLSFDELSARARGETATNAKTSPLSTLHWSRLTVLRAFVTPLPHAQAAALPLLVLPPNRVQVRNPIQALQVLLTLLLAHSGWSKQLPAWQALMPDAAARRELQAFFLCLVAKALATRAMAGQARDAQSRRWALEDAWRHPQVQAHWKRFALRLDEASAQAIVDRALSSGLAPRQVHGQADDQAIAGWSVDEAPATASLLPAPSAAGRASLRPVTGRRLGGTAPSRQLALPMDD